MSDASEYIGSDLLAALQNAKIQTDLIGDRVTLTQQMVNREIADRQYSEQLRMYSMAIG